MGFAAGRYLVESAAGGQESPTVLWLPGPEGAGWVADADRGFREALAGSGVRIVETLHGDTGSSIQRALIEGVLDRGDVPDFIVGTAVSAEAAADVLRRRGLSERVGVIAFYYGPGIHRAIRRGSVLAAPSDQTALQSRLAIDVMVRELEGLDPPRHLAPRVLVVDREGLATFDATTTLAPRGFRPVLSIRGPGR
jgi:protein TorT